MSLTRRYLEEYGMKHGSDTIDVIWAVGSDSKTHGGI